MNKLIAKAVGWLLAGGVPAWFAYVIYAWITYSGVWRRAAQWELDHLGSYDEKLTFIVVLFVPSLAVGSLVYLVLKLFPVEAAATASRPAAPLRTMQALIDPAKAPKQMAIVAIVAALIGIGSGALGYIEMQQPVTFEPIDLAGPAAPQTRHATLRGVAQTGTILVLKETLNGHVTETSYLPLTGPSWRRGEPVAFFLRPRGNVYVDRDGAKVFDPQTRPFPVETQGTLFRNGLPGLVQAEFEKRGIVMAHDTFVVDPKVDADLDVYFVIALGGLIGALVMALAAFLMRQKMRRARA
jgi:hypothetical protein